jgi:hypothetical protein
MDALRLSLEGVQSMVRGHLVKRLGVDSQEDVRANGVARTASSSRFLQWILIEMQAQCAKIDSGCLTRVDRDCSRNIRGHRLAAGLCVWPGKEEGLPTPSLRPGPSVLRDFVLKP